MRRLVTQLEILMADINIPTITAKEFTSIDNSALEKVKGTPDEVNDYLNSYLESGRMTNTDDVLTGLDGVSDSSFNYNNNKYRTYPHYPSDATNRTVSGRAAAARALTRVGGGVPVPIMLPHSGIWITVLPASEGEMLDLWRAMTNDKISLGRYTYGAVFSATSIITQRRLIDFCLKHVDACSVVLKDTGYTLKDVILINDIPFMFNGFGASMYPRGISYEAPCAVDPETCSHIERGNLMPETLAHYNSSAIPESVAHILASSEPNSVSLENVLLYQSVVNQEKTVTIYDETGLPTDTKFKVPNLTRAIFYGEKWVNETHNSVIDALALDQPTTDAEWSERNVQIVRKGKASFLCQYAAYVIEINMYDGGIVGDVPDDLMQVLTAMSSSDTMRKRMIEEVQLYIRNRTIGVIGVEAVPCPVCGRTPIIGGNNIIGQDPVRLFFRYLVGRVNRINQRSLT